jgi:hypothetical protein
MRRMIRISVACVHAEHLVRDNARRALDAGDLSEILTILALLLIFLHRLLPFAVARPRIRLRFQTPVAIQHWRLTGLWLFPAFVLLPGHARAALRAKNHDCSLVARSTVNHCSLLWRRAEGDRNAIERR